MEGVSDTGRKIEGKEVTCNMAEHNTEKVDPSTLFMSIIRKTG